MIAARDLAPAQLDSILGRTSPVLKLAIALGWLTDVPPARRAHVEATARVLEHELGDTRFTTRFPAPIQAELLSA